MEFSGSSGLVDIVKFVCIYGQGILLPKRHILLGTHLTRVQGNLHTTDRFMVKFVTVCFFAEYCHQFHLWIRCSILAQLQGSTCL